MDFDYIKNGLSRVGSLVEEWENDGASELERDLALDELRRIYAAIRFGSVKTDEPAEEPAEENRDVVVVPPVMIEATAAENDSVDDGEDADEPEIEVELIMQDEDFSEDEPEEDAVEEEEQPTAEESAEEEPAQPAEKEVQPAEHETQTVVEGGLPKEESVEAEVATTCDTAGINDESRKTEQSLFGDDEVVLSRSSRRRVIMSLYDDDMPTVISDRKSERQTKPGQVPETVVEADHSEEDLKPTAEESSESVAIPEIEEDMVLGDVLRSDIHTLGESIARPKGLAESAPVTSLRAAIGINDRFLLIRDLFDGDAAAYERAIVAIDSFDNLDDCMVHIVENYSWRSTSDGAKLIMNLIQRKFRK